MEVQYNVKSPAVKRLMREAEELRNPTYEYYAQPLEDNLFEWHFTVRGPSDSDFEGGYYHGRIILPTEYPMKPPSIIMLTPNGRFETNKKICLSISGHHPESWQPSWSIRTALLAIIGFMPTEGLGAIGSLDYPPEERKDLALKSQSFNCPSCGLIKKLLKDKSSEEETENSKEEKELAKQIRFKNHSESASTSSETQSQSSTLDTRVNESNMSNMSNSDSFNQVTNELTNELTPEVRQRRVQSNEVHSQNVNQVEENTNLQSSSRFSTYLIYIILIAFCLLLFRRLFLV